MARKPALTLATLTVLAALMTAPVQAGPFENGVGTLRVVAFEAQLTKGTARGILAILSGTGTFGRLSAPQASATTRTFVGNSNVPNDEGAVYVGCIEVKTPKGIDGGCSVKPAATINLDPLLRTGTLTFSVESMAQPGRQVTANLLLTGAGEPAPQVLPTFELTQTSSQRPAQVNLDLVAGLARGATVAGRVWSDGFEGGNVTSTDRAYMAQGLSVSTHNDLLKLVCTREREGERCHDNI